MSFDPARFMEAQAPVMAQVMAELCQGNKRTHWMWFVFPQIAGLGHSAMAKHYALASLEEARAYQAHPLLGPRLKACTEAVLAIQDASAHDIFGTPDALKFRSSMTLFAKAVPDETLFQAALEKYFGGEEDELTLEKLVSDGL